MSENNVNGIIGADVATTTGIVGATVAIGQYIVNDYVITIAPVEGDYGYTMTITRGSDTQTVTLYGLSTEQYNSMLGYLQQAQEAAQSAEGSASDASVRAISASDAANRALNFTLRAERACDSARSYETQAKTAKQDAETAKTQAQDYKQAAEAAATRAETAAEQITGMTAEAETLEPGSPATASFLDGVLSLGIPAGANGADGNGIVSIIKTGTSGNVDTYTITYTNGTTSTFTVRNGVDGAVTSVAGKTGAVTLNAGDVAFDDQQAYNDGTVGAGLTNLNSALGDSVHFSNHAKGSITSAGVDIYGDYQAGKEIYVWFNSHESQYYQSLVIYGHANDSYMLIGRIYDKKIHDFSLAGNYDFIRVAAELTQADTEVRKWSFTLLTNLQAGIAESIYDLIGSNNKIIEAFVTPQMYGAIGDGINDDTEGLQAAVNSGKRVIIPKGTYLISAPIVIQNPCICINGASNFYWSNGDECATIKAKNAITAVFEFANGVTCIDIENLNINGNAVANYGILHDDGENFSHDNTIKNVRVTSTNTAGIKLHNVYKSIFENVRAYACNVGFDLQGKYTGTAYISATTLTLIQCYADNCNSSFILSHISYSSLINCASDHANYFNYQMLVCSNITMLNCGCEAPKRVPILFSGVSDNVHIDGFSVFNMEENLDTNRSGIIITPNGINNLIVSGITINSTIQRDYIIDNATTVGEIIILDASISASNCRSTEKITFVAANGGVDDVQVNGVSVVTDGVANVPIATNTNPGVVKVNDNGVWMDNGEIKTNAASTPQLKAGVNSYNVVVPNNQHESTFYGLAKAAGDTTQRDSSNLVGSYTDGAKAAIKDMLGVSNAGDIAYDDTETYAAGSVGAGLAGLKSQAGDLANLDTVDKSSLVAAINEVAQSGGGGGETWHEAVMTEADYDSTLKMIVFDAGQNAKLKSVIAIGQIVNDGTQTAAEIVAFGIGNTPAKNNYSCFGVTNNVESSMRRLSFVVQCEVREFVYGAVVNKTVYPVSFNYVVNTRSGGGLDYDYVPSSHGNTFASIPYRQYNDPRYFKIELPTWIPQWAYVKIFYTLM